MSREIKFRAKCKQFNEWFYGDLVQELGGEKRTFILDCGVVKNKSQFDDFAVEVHPETVCQYTGLKDKNGKEIYEGDVVTEGGSNHFIEYDSEKAAYCYRTRKGSALLGLFYGEVIGSIYDKGGEA